jgi:rubrerythrin
MPRSFSSLGPAEVLQVAISIEQRNADVYQRFAEMFTEFGDADSREIAAVFQEMAVEEQGHRALLEEKYVAGFGALKQALTEDELTELVEVPKLDSANVFSSASDVTARERALHCALQAEHSAQQFYEKLVEETPEGPLRKIFSELAQMEDGHVAILEAKLESTAAKANSAD